MCMYGFDGVLVKNEMGRVEIGDDGSVGDDCELL